MLPTISSTPLVPVGGRSSSGPQPQPPPPQQQHPLPPQPPQPSQPPQPPQPPQKQWQWQALPSPVGKGPSAVLGVLGWEPPPLPALTPYQVSLLDQVPLMTPDDH